MAGMALDLVKLSSHGLDVLLSFMYVEPQLLGFCKCWPHCFVDMFSCLGDVLVLRIHTSFSHCSYILGPSAPAPWSRSRPSPSTKHLASLDRGARGFHQHNKTPTKPTKPPAHHHQSQHITHKRPIIDLNTSHIKAYHHPTLPLKNPRLRPRLRLKPPGRFSA